MIMTWWLDDVRNSEMDTIGPLHHWKTMHIERQTTLSLPSGEGNVERLSRLDEDILVREGSFRDISERAKLFGRDGFCDKLSCETENWMHECDTINFSLE